jgi:hypothetical protein
MTLLLIFSPLTLHLSQMIVPDGYIEVFIKENNCDSYELLRQIPNSFIIYIKGDSPVEKIENFHVRNDILLEKLILSVLKVKHFQPDFAIISARFFANSENATKFKETSEFKQEALNILGSLKFAGSHLAFYE